MKRTLGIVLIIFSLYIGYLGVQQFQKSTNSAEVLGIELKANDQGGQTTAIIEVVLALALFGGGVYLLSKRA